MPKTRSEKEATVSELVDRLGRMKALVVTTALGLKVKDVTELRRELRKNAVDFAVVKKTLFLRALEGAKLSLPAVEAVTGNLAVAFGYGDEILPAKLLAAFRKTHEGLTLEGGIVDGTWQDGTSMLVLAQLPSKHELLAKIVGLLAAPTSGFVRTVGGPARALAQALHAKASKT